MILWIFLKKDIIATKERNKNLEKGVSNWTYWTFEGIFLSKITAQMSRWLIGLIQDKDERTMSLFHMHENFNF